MRWTRRQALAGIGAALVAGGGAAPGMARAQGLRKIADLAYGPGARQRYDLYLPQGAGPWPVIALVHGGGWRLGDKGNAAVWQEKAAHWGAQGWALASVNYRMLPEVAPEGQAADVARAMAHLQTHGGAHGLATGRILAMGHSAGAHLLALLMAAPELATAQGARPWQAGVLLDTDVYDLAGYMRGRPSRLHRGVFGDDPAYWAQVSPLARLTRPMAPMLLVAAQTARRDTTGQAGRFASAVTARGGQAQVLPVGLSHAQINRQLGRPGAYTAAVERWMTQAMG
ncbi:alpha/beta hydrolase [Pseudooceanicola sp. 200-1SW]|uniref:alpha/beta hydrolase n=1 Tax=Pseudooceanicola sp. 200-1SW TaxID=3425949 RepID=UPI003D7FF973